MYKTLIHLNYTTKMPRRSEGLGNDMEWKGGVKRLESGAARATPT